LTIAGDCPDQVADVRRAARHGFAAAMLADLVGALPTNRFNQNTR